MERGFLKISPAIHAKEALIDGLIHLKDHQGSHHDDLAISLTLAAWQSTRGINHLMAGLPQLVVAKTFQKELPEFDP